jgi:hypothetical protein
MRTDRGKRITTAHARSAVTITPTHAAVSVVSSAYLESRAIVHDEHHRRG